MQSLLRKCSSARAVSIGGCAPVEWPARRLAQRVRPCSHALQQPPPCANHATACAVAAGASARRFAAADRNDRRRIYLLLLDLGFVNHSFVLFCRLLPHFCTSYRGALHRSRNCALDCDAYADHIDRLQVATQKIGYALGLDEDYSGSSAQRSGSGPIEVRPPRPFASVTVFVSAGSHLG